MLPPLTYLTTDSLAEGVGASQVLAYAERLADRGVDIRLHSFEKEAPSADIRQRITDRGVSWQPHPFGAYGARGGVARVVTGARAVRGAALVHARSDLAAAAAMLARSDHWLWDVRSLWADQRIALGALREGGPEHRMLRMIERGAARRSTAMVTLTEAVLPVLEQRHHVPLADKATVITTSVDTSRFSLQPLSAADPVIVMLAGTLNRYYDVPLMLRLVQRWQARRPVQLDVVTPNTTAWDDDLARLGATRSAATFAEMPQRVAQAHVGLSVCRADAGVSLTAAMPTKIGEFLATGRPIVVNANLGDAGELVEQHDCGVAVRPGDDIDTSLDRLDALLDDRDTPSRCRRLAETHFDLDRAVDRLVEIYARMASES